jgi:hypothetical protein
VRSRRSLTMLAVISATLILLKFCMIKLIIKKGA